MAAQAERLAADDPWAALVAFAAVTATALAVVLVLRTAFSRLATRVAAWRGSRLPPVRFQRQELLSADDTTNIALGAIRLVAAVAYVLLLYVYLNVAFRLFPITRGLADGLLDSLLGALQAMGSAIVGYLPNLVFLVVLFFAGRFLVRLLRLVFNGIAVGRIRLPGFDADWAWPTFKVVRFLVVVFLAVVAFPYLPGSTSPAFQGVSIFLGVLVSFGSSAAVADVISGIVLTYTRAFTVGDRVKIADAVGDVVEKTMFVTRVRTPKNVDVTLPNALVLGNPIVNYSAQARGPGLVLHPAVTIGYDAPWRQVHELLVSAARATEGVLEHPEPFVLQTALDDFYVRYELNVYTRDEKRMPAIYSELHRNILDAFHAAGVEIASPHLAAVRDGNQVQIPSDHLPKDYRPAAFRVLPIGRRSTGD